VTREHALFFLHGRGANGKGVFLNSLAGALGDYAKTAPIGTFLDTREEQHPTDLAGLCGARLVTAVETEDGRRWAEAKIKTLTGGDRIAARFMRQDFFEYLPQFKLLIAGNHKPGLRSVNEAMRRRLHLIPFLVTIPAEERDLDLAEKLRAEWPGILRWAVEGCLAWQDRGLDPPAAVSDATTKYLDAEDRIAAWIEDRCDLGPARSDTATALFLDWKSWAEAGGEKPGSQKAFSEKLQTRPGIEKTREGKARTRTFKGIALRAM
jgi:putative DNA primase/helicase